MEKIILNAEQFAVSLSKKKCPIGFESRVDVVNDIYDHLVFRLHVYVFGEDLGIKEISYPANWWEAFKDRWFPDWLKHRFPVRFQTERWCAKSLYPHLKRPVKNFGETVFLWEKDPFFKENPLNG